MVYQTCFWSSLALQTMVKLVLANTYKTKQKKELDHKQNHESKN